MQKNEVNSQENTIEGVPNHYHSPYPKIHVTRVGFLCLPSLATRAYVRFCWGYATIGSVELAIPEGNR